MKTNSKLNKLLAVSGITLASLFAYNKVSEANSIPLNIPVYEKISINEYPVFMLKEYYHQSKEQLGHLPKTWNEHILITDSMTFSPDEYKFQSQDNRELNLAEMQKLLGMKVGDGDKVKWMFIR